MIDMAETNVAITVQIPATRRIGKGREEPEPWPNLGRMPIVYDFVVSGLVVVRAEGASVLVDEQEEVRAGTLAQLRRDDGVQQVVVAKRPMSSRP